jgi:hypothetical protein
VSESIIDRLLTSSEPSVRWLTRSRVVGERVDSPQMHRLRDDVVRSPLVRRLLAGRLEDGRVVTHGGPYAKWSGAHWILSALADIGYPPGDPDLQPMFGQVLDCWLDRRYFRDVGVQTNEEVRHRQAVPVIQGRHRRCASQQGNALRYLTALGCTDGRVGMLAERLLHWQWPDGGWNCDRRPAAHTSSFEETLLALRGLAVYGQQHGSVDALAGAAKAAEVFLARRMLFRRADGTRITTQFGCLHYPRYWHYDYLGGLQAMVEAGAIADDRCSAALDLLEAQRLRDGGWATVSTFYATSPGSRKSLDSVEWGDQGTSRLNEWLTVDALAVLQAAGRLRS